MCVVNAWEAAVHLITHFSTDDGFISAKDLELSMGRGADVKQMIAAADKNGDGKVREPLASGVGEGIGDSPVLYALHVLELSVSIQQHKPEKRLMPDASPLPAACPALNFATIDGLCMQIDYAEFVEMLRNSA